MKKKMNGKRLPHEITVVAFVVFIVLGLACATMTPEEQAAYYAELAAAREGYEELSVSNRSQNLSIISIEVRGITDPTYTRSYQVSLRPASNAILPGGSFDIGEDKAGKKMVPIGEYEIILRWSNGAQSTHRVSSNRTLNVLTP
jgi:hypothetical protein